MNTKEKTWSSNLFFILATVGASVGLGNLWRFPYMAFENGGGSFFVPFVICYFLVALPIIFLEFGMGLWSRGSAATAFKKNSKKTTWIGCWILINTFVIVCYYSVIMGWCLQYAVHSIGQDWGNDTSSFFYNEIVQISPSATDVGGISIKSIVSLLVLWTATFFILKNGIKSLSTFLLISVPIPIILIIVLAYRGISLPGGMSGLTYFLKPDPEKLSSLSVWSAAASQVILSLGIGMSQMIAYSSKRKESRHNVKSAFALISGDFLFSLFAGIAVFATYGAMQAKLGIDVSQVPGDFKELDSLSVAFITYPAAISSLPYASIWGFLFFFMLVLLGIDSLFAVVEANMTDLEKLFPNMNRKKLIGIFCCLAFIGGLPFSTGAGLYWLDIVDHWVGYYAIFSIVILQCILFAHSSKFSEIGKKLNFKTKSWLYSVWKFMLSFLLPIMIMGFLLSNFIEETKVPYGNGSYSNNLLIFLGWGVMFLTIICGFFVSKHFNKRA